jgi:hypothetical protein
MIGRIGFLSAVAVLALGAFSSPALAHTPFCRCEMADRTTIRCKGGFSDGTSAEGVKLDVIAYNETILLSRKFDARSTVEFKKPGGTFYILFDAGPGNVIDVDHRELR